MGYKTYTCPIARTCGGCEWLAVPYPIQLRRKQDQVAEELGSLAEADGAVIEPILGMDEPRAYRHKAATPFAPGKKGRIRSGFYARGTHHIVRCDACLVEPPQAREALEAVARIAERMHVKPYHEDSGRGVLRHAVIRLGYATDEALLTLVTNGDTLPKEREFVAAIVEECPWITSIAQNVNDRRTNAILGNKTKTLYGSGIMHDELLGCSFEISPTSFYQTNPAQTEKLYDLAIQMADLRDGKRLLDAYCGTGTIGICAAHEAAARGAQVQVVGVERVSEAIAAAKRNARANELGDACSFVAADATEWLAARAKEDARFDVVVLDPPRAGSTPQFLRACAKSAPERIVYVSCNVSTQARDIALLRESGYKLSRVVPVDMFPHTKHVECVALLTAN